MIKYSNQNIKDNFYKQTIHIISQLYKIKKIDRKKIYDKAELKLIVMSTNIGEQVITELKTLGITRTILKEYDLFYFDSILGDEFPKD